MVPLNTGSPVTYGISLKIAGKNQYPCWRHHEQIIHKSCQGVYDTKEKVNSYLHRPRTSLKGLSDNFNQTTEYCMGTG